MTKPKRLDVAALAAELSKLPNLTAASAAHVDPVQLALARAVASGQSADQLAKDLSVPAGWTGVDLSKPPAALGSITAIEPAAAAEPEAKPAVPEWIAKVAPLALESKITTRVVVLDREPTALGGLELPAWARALSPSAVYGPVTAAGTGMQLQTPKWIVLFNFKEIVEFIRGTQVLCVLPLSIFHFGSPKSASILSGSAWIAAHLFVATAPADSFAGLTIQSGVITSDQPLNFSSTIVTVPAGATVTLDLTPAPSSVGPAGFPSKVTAPTKIAVVFPPAGTPTIVFNHCDGTLYGEHIKCTTAHKPVLYNAELKLLYVEGHTTVGTFQPKPVTGKLLTLSGHAPLLSAGWALAVSESTTPANLGTAVNSGGFAIVFGGGIGCQWKGASRIEPAAIGNVIATNDALSVSAFSGSAPGVVVEEKFQLWDDQDASKNSGRRCQLVTGRSAGQLLTYALAGNLEILELGAFLEALVDRPLLATGARVPAIFLEALVALIHTNAGNRLIVYSTTPLPQTTGPNNTPSAYPMALDNAILDVSQPVAIYLTARTDADFNATSGQLFLLFGYLLVELYLPDPYTGGLNLGNFRDNPTFGETVGKAGGVASYGYLAAEVSWTSEDKATLRLADLAHTHPATPPPTEAGSTAVSPSHFHPIELEPIPQPIAFQRAAAPSKAALVAKDVAVAPQSIGPVQPPPSDPVPSNPNGATLLDLSTRASQLGLEVIIEDRSGTRYTIDGLSVRGPANLLPLTTLPAIA